ncbi:MAG: Flp pilus assembly protein CpaB [Rhizobiales bacterium NRL2]|jgi:pilus assembly protein CpaB|nr:MAG: Flp pilus assembly protein CpaB [Rhizobiales bacterium NRL2]
MNYRLILAGAVALSAAGGAAWLANAALSAPPPAAPAAVLQTVPQPASTVEVLVSARPIRAGDLLQADDVRWQAWPKDAMTETYVVRAGESAPEVAGRVSPTAIAAGLPIVPDALIRPGERGFLAAVLPPGHRATTIPIDATTGVAGFVFPGDRVDLILTFSVDGERGDSLASQTVLHDLRVLAIDQKMVQQDGHAAISKTATVEVTPEQAEKIALALQLGRLSLSLRAVTAGSETDATSLSPRAGYTVAGDVSPLFNKRVATNGAGKPPVRRVTVMRGGEASEVEF